MHEEAGEDDKMMTMVSRSIKDSCPHIPLLLR